MMVLSEKVWLLGKFFILLGSGTNCASQFWVSTSFFRITSVDGFLMNFLIQLIWFIFYLYCVEEICLALITCLYGVDLFVMAGWQLLKWRYCRDLVCLIWILMISSPFSGLRCYFCGWGVVGICKMPKALSVFQEYMEGFSSYYPKKKRNIFNEAEATLWL